MRTILFTLLVVLTVYLASVLACNLIHKPQNFGGIIRPDGDHACGSCWSLGIK